MTETAYEYSDISITHIEDMQPFSVYNLTEDFNDIIDIKVDASGSVVIYQITGVISPEEGEPEIAKKIMTINSNIITSYLIFSDEFQE